MHNNITEIRARARVALDHIVRGKLTLRQISDAGKKGEKAALPPGVWRICGCPKLAIKKVYWRHVKQNTGVRDSLTHNTRDMQFTLCGVCIPDTRATEEEELVVIRGASPAGMCYTCSAALIGRRR